MTSPIKANTPFVSPITLGGITDKFTGVIKQKEDAVKKIIDDHTDADGKLTLDAGSTLQLQQAMASQNVMTVAATGTLNSIKDSIKAAARNIG